MRIIKGFELFGPLELRVKGFKTHTHTHTHTHTKIKEKGRERKNEEHCYIDI